MHKNFWQTAAEKAVLAHCSGIELALVALRVGQWLNRGYSIETAVVPETVLADPLREPMRQTRNVSIIEYLD